MTDADEARRSRLDAALKSARETRAVEVGRGALTRVVELFRAHFGDREPVIVADAATFNVAGRNVQETFVAAGVKMQPPFIFTDPDLYAQYDFVDDLDEWMASHQA